MVGQRITAEVIAVDLDAGRVRLSMAATENPDGTVAAIERFGVFVALDEGPDHPVHPGVGFITYPELSLRRFEAASEVVELGQRVSCTVEGLVPLGELGPAPVAAPEDVVRRGDEVLVTVTDIDRERGRLTLCRLGPLRTGPTE